MHRALALFVALVAVWLPLAVAALLVILAFVQRNIGLGITAAGFLLVAGLYGALSLGARKKKS
jgi:branched-subunit amino acid transport protein AzlD